MWGEPTRVVASRITQITMSIDVLTKLTVGPDLAETGDKTNREDRRRVDSVAVDRRSEK
jgi:hypothetical protein